MADVERNRIFFVILNIIKQTRMIVPVAAAIIFSDGKVLIARRATHKHLAGLWEFPGGKVEKHESPEMCIARELDEELKIRVTVQDFLTEHEHDFGTFKILLKAYICSFIAGDFTLTDHDAIKWADLDQLADFNLAPADIPLVSAISNYVHMHPYLSIS